MLLGSHCYLLLVLKQDFAGLHALASGLELVVIVFATEYPSVLGYLVD
jgi:hypothetical protein